MEKPLGYKEKELLNDYKDDFAFEIRKRGSDYYYSNHVISVFKCKNKYIAKVSGSNINPYKVVIETDDEEIYYSCSCPCEFPCKHEYAVLMAINNKDYQEIELMEDIEEQDIDFKTIIEKIPANEIKDYLLSDIGMDKVIFEMAAFKNYFRKYYPFQKYEYYYNKLYNAMVLDDDYFTLIKEFLKDIKEYINSNSFVTVLNIIEAIINAYHDSNKLNYDENFTDILPMIGMFLRVTYRKANKKIKNKVSNWILELEKDNFYNNYYLEDIMLSVK